MTGTFTPKGRICGPIVPSSLMKKTGISMGAKLLYAALVSCARPGQEYCWPSQAWLADQIGASVRSIQNYLAELEKLGVILIDRSRLGSSLRYYFMEHEDIAVWTPKNKEVENTDGYAELAGGYAKSAYINNYNNKLQNTPLSPHESDSPDVPVQRAKQEDGAVSALDNSKRHFLEIWSLWPRKEAPYAAEKVWRELWFSGQLPSPTELKQKIEVLQKHDRAWSRGYIPYFVTWLRDRRWEDQLAPSTTTDFTDSQNNAAPESLHSETISNYYEALLKQKPREKDCKAPNPIPIGLIHSLLQRTPDNAKGQA